MWNVEACTHARLAGRTEGYPWYRTNGTVEAVLSCVARGGGGGADGASKRRCSAPDLTRTEKGTAQYSTAHDCTYRWRREMRLTDHFSHAKKSHPACHTARRPPTNARAAARALFPIFCRTRVVPPPPPAFRLRRRCASPPYTPLSSPLPSPPVPSRPFPSLALPAHTHNHASPPPPPSPH